MKVKIYPSICNNQVVIPPSKSISHRAIICACLASGKSVIKNLAFSDDIKATIDGMRQLGAIINEFDDYVEIYGISKFPVKEKFDVNCNESGSTLRFFIPIFSLTNKRVCLHGENRLLKRPQSIYNDLFVKQGLEFNQKEDCIEINGSLKPLEYELDGNISSQFITGLLFALPLLNGNSIIKIKPPFESRSYIDLTLQVMSEFGVLARFIDDYTIEVKGNQQYKPCDYIVEGDFSQLAFFAVLGAINSGIDCIGVNHNSLQGDRVIIEILKNSGVKVKEIQDGYRIGKSNINKTEIDLSDCPDLGPILTVLAMFSNGKTKIYNAGRLRLKESDRIEAMETELKKFGVNITTTQDEIIIDGKMNYSCTQQLFAHNDHRIAMSLSVAVACSNSSAVIDGAECINKSYPAFFEDLQKLGIKILIEE